MKRLMAGLMGTTAMLAGCATTGDTALATPMEAERTLATDAATPTDNPLLAKWTGAYDGLPPFGQIELSDYPPAFTAGMAELKGQIDAIATNPAAPTFANTMEAMERAGGTMDRVYAAWGVQTSNLSNEQVRAIEAEWEPKLSSFFSELYLNPELFARVETLYNARDTLGLEADQRRLLERSYDRFVRRGAKLSPDQRARAVAIEGELAGLFSSFSEKVLGDEEKVTLVTDRAQLAGLPDSLVASFAAAAKERGQTGWSIKNTRSSMTPVLENATDRALRETVWRAYAGRGDNGDANDTNATIARILKLRQERAELLGFETHADYRMADTMAGTPDRAMDLMMKVWPAAKARVAEEVAEMQALANSRGDRITIQPWDYRFYAEKVRKAKYDLDATEVKSYFQLSNMVDAMFYSANRLYGLSFKENTGSVPVFHPDVRTFEVTDADGQVAGVFYFDPYARDGKRSGAWATTYRSRAGLTNDRIVLGSNNNNFTKPADGEVALISLDDAQTLFHEFGHALHYFISDVKYPGLGGTPRDFVEYPSQVNENWVTSRDVLDKFARHYQTGEPMPQALLDKIEASSTYGQGFSTVEYLSSALVDMKLHDRTTPVTDADAFERDTLAELGMPGELVMRHRLPQFNHLFASDGYSAGYYSYLWSETMDADTWAAFEETGDVWNKDVATRFKTMLLATGNETDRAEAYRAFRGRDPDVNALLKRRGFPTQ